MKLWPHKEAPPGEAGDGDVRDASGQAPDRGPEVADVAGAPADQGTAGAAEPARVADEAAKAAGLGEGVCGLVAAAHDDVDRLVDASGADTGTDPADPRNRWRVFDTVIAAVSAHVSAMMTVLYPQMHRVLPEAREELRRLEAGAREMASVMRGMEQHLNGDTNRPAESIGQLRSDLAELLEAHTRAEERLLARMDEVWSDDERRDWTVRFERAMRHAPTRPHPHLPKSHALMSPAVGLSARWDHILDTLDARAVAGRPVRQPGPPGLWGWYLLGRPAGQMPAETEASPRM